MELHFAAAAGAMDELRQLISEDTHLDARDADGWTALMHAAAATHVGAIQLLLEAGADPNARWSSENLSAISDHDEDDDASLDEEAGFDEESDEEMADDEDDWNDEDDWDDEDFEDDDGYEVLTPLLLVFESEDGQQRVLEAIQLLLAAGADVGTIDGDGQTSLMHAVQAEFPEVVRRVLEAGVDVNATDREGNTALHLALGVDEDRAVVAGIAQQLFEAGADVHVKNCQGATPLMRAAATAYVDLVRTLLESGCDPSATDAEGHTALSRAAEAMANLTFDDVDCGLDPDEMRVGVEQMGVDPDSERGRQMLELLQNRKQSAEFTLQMSGVESADEFQRVRAEGLKWLNEIVDLLAEKGSPLEAAVPFLAKAGRDDLLRTEGLDLDAQDQYGQTALTAAVESGKVDRVRVLLQAGANPNTPNYLEQTPLMAVPSTRRGFECARILLDAGSDLNARGLNDLTVLETAIEPGEADRVQILLEAGADLQIGTPVLWAVNAEDSAILHLLLDHGADPNGALQMDGKKTFAGYFKGTTPLMVAAACGATEIFETLLQREADVNAADRTGRTAVEFAMAHGRLDFAELLRKHGATPTGTAGYSAALLPAAKQGNFERVCACLAQGADPNASGKRALTSLIVAAREGHAEVVRRLIDAGANVNACSEPGYSGGNQTPLRCAVVRGHAQIVEWLVQAGADVRPVYVYSSIPSGEPNTIVPSSGSALHDAARAGREDIAEILIQAGADGSVPDEHDETPLVAAVRGRHWELARRLLAGGSQPRPQDADFLTALDFPTAAGRPQFAESIAELEQLCGTTAETNDQIPGMVVLKVLPDGDASTGGNDADSYREEFAFARKLDAKMWHVLDAGYDDCLSRGHLVINSGLPFLGGNKHRFVHLLPTSNKYAALALIGVRGNEVELSTRQIIDWLRDFEKDHPFRLRGCRFDIVEIEFTTEVADPETTARRLNEFCPDLTAQNFDSMADLVRHVATERRVHLWWD